MALLAEGDAEGLSVTIHVRKFGRVALLEEAPVSHLFVDNETIILYPNILRPLLRGNWLITNRGFLICKFQCTEISEMRFWYANNEVWNFQTSIRCDPCKFNDLIPAMYMLHNAIAQSSISIFIKSISYLQRTYN